VVKLGGSAAFVGKVGDDPFGEYLRYTLDQVGVDTSHLVTTVAARTTLVFVAVRRDARKDMCFYRHPGADMLLAADEIDEAWLGQAKAFHFGSISLLDEGPRAATLKAAQLARQAGRLVTFDPNYRAHLWPSVETARAMIQLGLALADVVKVADEEFETVAGTADEEAGVRGLLERGPRLVLLTRGAGGCSFYRAAEGSAALACRGEVAGFGVEAIETTGAGDGFIASVILDLLAERAAGREVAALDEATLRRICRRANAVGAITCTRMGAIPGLPTRDEVEKFLARVGE
jgi:fructokinase